MKIYLLRHAEAHDVGTDGIRSDAARTLTAKGREDIQRLGRLLALLDADISQIVSSPLVRARETATLLVDAHGAGLPIEIHEALAPPGDAEALLMFLRASRETDVLLVGHEPFLGEFLQALLNQTLDPAIPLSKSSLACIDVDASLGNPKLCWLLNRNLTKKLLDIK